MAQDVEKSNFVGGCVCGHVRYSLNRPPIYTHCCHCTDCQQLTGSAFAINATIEASAIEITSGIVKPYVANIKDGSPHEIYRCEACLSPLWSSYGGRSLRSVRLGSLDQSEAVKPDAHIFLRSKLAWVSIPDGAKSFEAFYDIKAEWPQESLARLKLALKDH